MQIARQIRKCASNLKWWKCCLRLQLSTVFLSRLCIWNRLRVTPAKIYRLVRQLWRYPDYFSPFVPWRLLLNSAVGNVFITAGAQDFRFRKLEFCWWHLGWSYWWLYNTALVAFLLRSSPSLHFMSAIFLHNGYNRFYLPGLFRITCTQLIDRLQLHPIAGSIEKDFESQLRSIPSSGLSNSAYRVQRTSQELPFKKSLFFLHSCREFNHPLWMSSNHLVFYEGINVCFGSAVQHFWQSSVYKYIGASHEL